MKQIQLFPVLILCTLFSVQTYSQGCYYSASFSHVNNGSGVVSFTNTSGIPYSQYSSWNFGDGSTASGSNPTHTYTVNGYYTVTLNVTYVQSFGPYGNLTCNTNTSTNIIINNANSTYGCMDTTSCNYSPNATIDDGSCILASTLVTLQMNDSYGDGWNGDTWTATSTSGGVTYGPFTLNSGYSGTESFCLADDCYDITVGGGSYPYETSWLLIDDNGTTLASGGSPYNSGLNTGTSSCPILGCMDTTATNYDPLANTDDGSCLFCPVYIWTEVTPLGCPNNNNGALQVEIISGPTPSNISYVWSEQIYIPPYSSQTNTLPFTGSIATGLGLDWYKVNIQDNSGCAGVEIGWAHIGVRYGCTGALASNYDSTANCDDGSCTYIYGCTDSIATNYNSNAGVDNGSCIYPHICGEITGVTLSDIIDDRVTFNWDDMNDSLCLVDQIRIRYRETGTSTYSTKTMGAPVGNNSTCLSTSKRILNLSDSTKYEYGFKIWYQDGTINNWHSEGTFITLDRCPNVGNLSATTPSSSRAKFTWDDSNGSYSFLRIKIRVDSISNPTSSSWVNSGGFGINYGTFSSIKNGLVPGETYRAQAKTWCDPAGGPYKAPSWTPLIFWTQPSSVRLEGGTFINNLAIYPNPSRDIFSVSFSSEDVQNLEVRIINVIGEIIYSENLQQFFGEHTKQVDLAAYTKGVYFLEIETNDGIVNKKLILN